MLGRKGYILDTKSVSREVLEALKRDLTVRPKVDTSYGGFPKSFKVFVVNRQGTRIAIPKFYADRHTALPPGRPAYDRVDQCPALVFCGKLNEALKQPDAVNAALKALRGRGGAIISLVPGGGKTVCALNIACALGGKTLILVHKEFLMNQWIERIKQFIPTASVGRLQQDTVEVAGRDIVVAMIHSVALKEYPPGTFDGFATVMVDECHHISAPMFSQAMFVVGAPHVLGLSATPERKDGLEKVLGWFMGDIVYQTKREQQHQVRVEVLHFDPGITNPPMTRGGNICLPQLITELTENPERNRLLVDTITAHASGGRKVIVLSDRREHCFWLQSRIPVSGLYIGGMTEEELKKSEACSVIIATYGLATEGLDIPALDTLVLSTPKSDVVQASGRILRECLGKANDPLIVDVVDLFGMFFAQFNKRKRYYISAGFRVPGVQPTPAPGKYMMLDE
jgi:superfamily II DNA or RNA helicase